MRCNGSGRSTTFCTSLKSERFEVFFRNGEILQVGGWHKAQIWLRDRHFAVNVAELLVYARVTAYEIPA